MRYIILKDRVSADEVKARIQYIYDVFHIYTYVENIKNGRVTLKSMPSTGLDVMFIVGHSPNTNSFFEAQVQSLEEKDVIIISCNTKGMEKLGEKYRKNLYLPTSAEEVALYSGEKYKFGFDVTEEEILMYRNRKEAYSRMLNLSFERKFLYGKNN